MLTRTDAVSGEGFAVAGYAAAEIMRGPLVVAKGRLAVLVGIGYLVSLAVTFAMVPPQAAQSDVVARIVAGRNGVEDACGSECEKIGG